MDENSIKIKFDIARKKINEKDFQQAKILFKEIIKEDPNHFGALFLLGTIYGMLDNFDLAIESLLSAIAVNKDNINAHFNIAQLYKKKKNIAKSKKHLQSVLEIKPNHIETICTLGQILEEENNFEDAKKRYEEGLKIDPNSKLASQLYGKFLFKVNEHEKALEYTRIGSGFVRFTNDKFKII